MSYFSAKKAELKNTMVPAKPKKAYETTWKKFDNNFDENKFGGEELPWAH